MDKIETINQGENPICKELIQKKKFHKIIKALNSHFKWNNQYDYRLILRKRALLALLLAFYNKETLDRFFEDYLLYNDHFYKTFYLPSGFLFDEYIPMKTIFYFYEFYGEGRKPLFYDVFDIYSDEQESPSDEFTPVELCRTKSKVSIKGIIPEGITGINFHEIRYSKDDKYFKYLADMHRYKTMKFYKESLLDPINVDIVRELETANWGWSYQK